MRDAFRKKSWRASPKKENRQQRSQSNLSAYRTYNMRRYHNVQLALLFVLIAEGCNARNSSNDDDLVTVQQISATPPATLLNSTSWDYSPSWMVDTAVGKDRMWWCSDRFNQGEPSWEGDVIKYSEKIGTGAWSAPLTVLTPTGTGWEGPCTCDPAVIRGSFNFQGQAYSLAMYYTAAQNCAAENKIGVAFSNDGINWTKTGAPIISSQFSGNGFYGAGEAQVRNATGGSVVQLWHIDTPSDHAPRFYERASNDGITFGEPTPLTSEGIQGDQGVIAAGVALSPTAPYFLYLINRDNTSRTLKVYQVPYDLRFTGSWSYLGEVTPTSGGEAAIFEAGFRTDVYGNIYGGTFPQIFAGFGCGTCYIDAAGCDPFQWKLCQALIQ